MYIIIIGPIAAGCCVPVAELRVSSHRAALSFDDSSTVIVTLEYWMIKYDSRPLFLMETCTEDVEYYVMYASEEAEEGKF